MRIFECKRNVIVCGWRILTYIMRSFIILYSIQNTVRMVRSRITWVRNVVSMGDV
jgi:hypothetical protein